MESETTNDAARENVRQGTGLRGLYGICFQVAWVRAARDARQRRRSDSRIDVRRDAMVSKGAMGGGDSENVFERVLI